MLVYGLIKIRNEVVREGNLYRLLDQLELLCDGGIICDDASTDGTREVIDHWIDRMRDQHAQNWWPCHTKHADFQREMSVKQEMMNYLHTLRPCADWVLWMDGDELFDDAGLANFRGWLGADGEKADVWAFHYTQLWRGIEWARTDDGFDNGWFWKLWRYRPDLHFEIVDRLHSYQFPKNYYDQIMVSVGKYGGSHGKARRAPMEILHLGNVGKNLIWKAIQYCNSGPLESASLKRHLYFDHKAEYRAVLPTMLPKSIHTLARLAVPPKQVSRAMACTDQETKIIERMGDLKQREGLCVVIIPTFNRAHRLPQAIESVRAQTYENWVCVVLDDGSTDNTQEVMRGIVDSDPRIFYCRYPENRGGVAMNEIGCALACDFGEFWIRLGSDDYFKPHKLALDVAALREFPGAVACYGPYRDLHNEKNERDLRGLPADVRGALLSHGFAAGWANIAVRTSALRVVRERYGHFVDPEIRNMEDFLLNVRIAYLGEFVWRAQTKKSPRKFFVAQLHGAASVVRIVQEEIGSLDDLDHDAVWRIAADGASQKPAVCNTDASITMARLQSMAVAMWPDGTPKHPPMPREETTIVVKDAP